MVRKSNNEDPYVFGLLLEQRVNTMEKTIKDIKNSFITFGNKMDGRMTELFNHQSTHVPQETLKEIKTQWKIIAFLASGLSALVGIAGTFIIAMFAGAA